MIAATKPNDQHIDVIDPAILARAGHDLVPLGPDRPCRIS
jgi:hypothetical protein